MKNISRKGAKAPRKSQRRSSKPARRGHLTGLVSKKTQSTQRKAAKKHKNAGPRRASVPGISEKAPPPQRKSAKKLSPNFARMYYSRAKPNAYFAPSFLPLLCQLTQLRTKRARHLRRRRRAIPC